MKTVRLRTHQRPLVRKGSRTLDGAWKAWTRQQFYAEQLVRFTYKQFMISHIQSLKRIAVDQLDQSCDQNLYTRQPTRIHAAERATREWRTVDFCCTKQHEYFGSFVADAHSLLSNRTACNSLSKSIHWDAFNVSFIYIIAFYTQEKSFLNSL